MHSGRPRASRDARAVASAIGCDRSVRHGLAGLSVFDASCQWLRDARNAAVVQSWLPAASDEAACSSGYHLKQNVAPDADALPNSTGTACIACAAGMFSIENAKECIACFPGNGIALAVAFAFCLLPLPFALMCKSGSPRLERNAQSIDTIGTLAPIENVRRVQHRVLQPRNGAGQMRELWRRRGLLPTHVGPDSVLGMPAAHGSAPRRACAAHGMCLPERCVTFVCLNAAPT